MAAKDRKRWCGGDGMRLVSEEMAWRPGGECLEARKRAGAAECRLFLNARYKGVQDTGTLLSFVFLEASCGPLRYIGV